jgi:hypothetical protein
MGSGCIDPHFLDSALVEGECSASRPGHFNLEKMAPGTHYIGGWVDSTAGMDDMDKLKILALPGHELRLLLLSVCSQSL